jgi:phage portal protein BeeE
MWTSNPEDDSSATQVRDHPILTLLRAPNRFANGIVMDAYTRNKLTALYWALVGNAFLEVQRGPTGPVALILQPPSNILATPSREAPYYEVAADVPGIASRKISPVDMVWIRDPDPLDPYGYGVGVGSTLGDELDTDEGAAHHAKAKLYNHGMPAGLVVIEGIDANSRVAIEREMNERYGGPDKAGRIHVASGKATFTPLSDQQLFSEGIQLRAAHRDMFMQTAGFPPELAGIHEGSTRDSVYIASSILATSALIPYHTALCSALQTQLLRPQDGWLTCASPIPEDRDFRLRAMGTAPSAFRVRDIRRTVGMEPDPERDELPLSEAQTVTETQTPSVPGEDRGKNGDDDADL